MRAVVSVPGSKSLTNRYLVLAAAADSPSTVRNPLRSRDTSLMVGALRALGAVVDDADGSVWRIAPLPAPGELSAEEAAEAGSSERDPLSGSASGEGVSPGQTASAPADDAVVDCGLAGTVMRFIPPLAAATGRRVRIDGDEQARTRPMTTMLAALRDLGVDVETAGEDRLPFSLSAPGGVRGGHLDIDASASSQFVSGLLLAGGLFDLGLELRHTGETLPSRPHIDMTREVLEDAGVHVEEPDERTWRVEHGRPRGLDVVVEPDLSNAATFLAAALVTGGSVTVPHWPAHTTQAGDAFRAIAEAFGGTAELTRSGLTVTGPQTLRGVDLDLSAVGELTPVVAAVAACAPAPSALTGIGHLRGHETDRLSALAAELTACGAVVEEGADSLRILSPATRPALWHTYHDHRMVMAGAVLALRIDGLEIENPTTVGKTMPDFTALWAGMLGA